MESTQFCGQTCHSVMDPEYTAYQRSPHARVACVECHIGPGAPWFVRSKLSGSYQVLAVTFNLYPRPIPTPIHNLRPARETCEQCHWPERFSGDKLVIRTKYADDEKNSATKTVLLVHIGGRNPDSKLVGIHGRHLGLVTYIAGRRQAAGDSLGELSQCGRNGDRVCLHRHSAQGRIWWRTVSGARWIAWTATTGPRIPSTCRKTP